MSGKFMKFKKIIIPIMSLIILTSQLTGCAALESREMIKMIDRGESIMMEVSQPSYEVNVLGQQKQVDWIQLDQLKTHKEFRQDFDTLFNINIVTEKGLNGKSGCLYVDESGDRNGNTTLEDALRNKAFVTKYWQDNDVKDGLVKLSDDIYTDTDGNMMYGITGSLNAYYSLLEDAENPSAFNPTQSLTREQFYTLVFKAEEGVQEIKNDGVFEKAIGGGTPYSKFAQGVSEYGFLSVDNKSLDEQAYKGSISRAEAVYMVVNKHFPKELAKVNGEEKAFKDTKNGGDVARTLGFKYKDKETKEIIPKDRWQMYTLATMLQHPNKGMQEEIYNAMVVAKKLGLIPGEESRWDEPISKAEGIQLVMNTHLAKNKIYGYLSEVEYGKINPDKFGYEVVFTPDGEAIPNDETVIDWEEPPVVTVYNPTADINKDGHVDKSEWEKWVKANPGDLNKDLAVTAEEKAEFNSDQNASSGTSGTGVGSVKPPVSNGGNNGSSTVKPPVNNGGTVVKPTPPTPPSPPVNSGGMTQEAKDAAKKMDEEQDDFLRNWGSGSEGDGYNIPDEKYQRPFRAIGESDESWQVRKQEWNSQHPDNPVK